MMFKAPLQLLLLVLALLLAAEPSQGYSKSQQLHCPPGGVPVTLAGCPCDSNSTCPAGYRCSSSAAAALASVGWSPGADFTNGTAADRADSGICIPCLLGEFCPEGTQEASSLSISGCQLASSNQPGAKSACKRVGYSACPDGMFCPNASVAKPCEPGRWCAEGSVASDACGIENLLAWDPFKHVRSEPQSLLTLLVSSGQPLTGNTCPDNSSTPVQPCATGYFCPSPSRRLVCPIGAYCPEHSRQPLRCPPLASCATEGLGQPNWSWQGLLMMLLLLLLLLAGLEYLRRWHSRGPARGGSLEDEALQLVAAVGFQMAMAGVRRTSQAQDARLERLKHTLSRVLSARHIDVPGDSLARNAAPKDSNNLDAATGRGLQRSEEATQQMAPPAAHSYTISPRVTLVFRSVWVSDRPMTSAVAAAAKRVTHVARIATGCLHVCGNNSEAATTLCNPTTYAGNELAAAASARGVKFLVPGVSGCFASAQLHAVFGPSGCGKTTLCRALSGRLPATRVAGDIQLICSSDDPAASGPSEPGVALNSPSMAFLTGFVPQFDLLHETLTVVENLELAARLRLPVSSSTSSCQGGPAAGCSGLSSRQQRNRDVQAVVDEVLALMALNKVAHSCVGTSTSRVVSGGQRKRAAIGVELVAKPSLLFLDEPTSGLDASVAADVVAALKQSSERGMNVLAVMHQPRVSIFGMFDTCTLLAASGQVAYAGPQALAVHYLGFLGFQAPAGENAADFLLDVTAGVVSRPGDEDFLPSQLPLLWQQCGSIWIEQQQQQQPSVWPADQQSSGAVDWPWRPRDLEALLTRFNNAAASKQATSSTPDPRAVLRPAEWDDEAAVMGQGGLLDFDGFLRFFDDDGLKEVLGEERHTTFMEAMCEDFAMAPGVTISRPQFMRQLKQHMKAAATAAGSAAMAPLSPASSGLAAAAEMAQPSDMGGRSADGARLLTSPSMRVRLQQQRSFRSFVSKATLSKRDGDAGMDWRAQQQQQQQQQQQTLGPHADAATLWPDAATEGRQQQQAPSLAAIAKQIMQRQQQTAPEACEDTGEPAKHVKRGFAVLAAEAARQAAAERQATSAGAANPAQQGSSAPMPAAAAAPTAEPAAALAATAVAVEQPAAARGVSVVLELRQPADKVAAVAQAQAGRASAASTAAVATLLSNRRLPTFLDQLWLVVCRSGRKSVSSRGALMTDLLLVAMLGLALGAAQGHISNPADSVLWMLITLLAFGCMTLARSIKSFGEERALYLQQESPGGVRASAWVFGHQLFDVVGLLLHPALFFAWLYVMSLPAVSALTYFFSLVAVGWYTSGIGYLVSLVFAPQNTLLAGLAAGLLLGGVANGVAPKLWSLSSAHPLTWLDQLSYTRWGLQALYVDWLTPSPPERAPATAAFLGSLGFCGLDPRLSLRSGASGGSAGSHAPSSSNSTGAAQPDWLNMDGVQRADAIVAAAAANHRDHGEGGPLALALLWQYYNRPELLHMQCLQREVEAFAVLLGLGLLFRVLLLVVVQFKVARKRLE